MKKLFITLLLVIQNVTFAEIAAVNYNAIEDLLLTYFLDKPENSDLKEKHKEVVLKEAEYEKKLHETISSGKLDLNKHAFADHGAFSEFSFKRSLDGKLRKEVYLLIKKEGLDFDFIYDSSATDLVFYAKSGTTDITHLLRQAIIDRMEEAPKSQEQ